MGNRNELAEKLELIGGMFEIDGIPELLRKFDPEEDEKGKKKQLNPVKVNAIVIQVESLLMKENPDVADRLVAMNRKISLEEAAALEDSDYANTLKKAIITDVLGFFASSASSDGKK